MNTKPLVLLTALAALPLTAAAPYRDRWQAVADRLMQVPAESFVYDWGEGVQMIGVMKAWERTKKPAYADYVNAWLAHHLARGTRALITSGTPGQHPGFCGFWSPAMASFYLHQALGKPEHLRLAVETAAFIEKEATRGREGELAHWQGNTQLWVDTLYMACPLLAGVGKSQNKPAYISDSANQLIVFSRHLQDAKADLFYHMWDWKTNERTPELWGRGNGWVLMSLADTLEAMDRGHRDYAALKKITGRMVRGLGQTQDDAGMWHTVMNDPKSYPETSATMMFCYGLLKLQRLNVLPASVKPMALKAWRAVNERYVKEGVVTGVSAGTVTSKSGDFYRKLPVGSETWGTGAYLMAGSEVDRLK